MRIRNFPDLSQLYPTMGWHLDNEQDNKCFLSYKAYGNDYVVTQLVCKDFNFRKPSKIINEKNMNILVNCDLRESEQVYLLHLTGGVRGLPYGIIYLRNVEVIVERYCSNLWNATASLVIKVLNDKDWGLHYLIKMKNEKPLYYVLGNLVMNNGRNKIFDIWYRDVIILNDRDDYEAYCHVNKVHRTRKGS